MAYVKDEQTTKININLTTDGGKVVRNFGNINPEITDTNLYVVGSNLASLQTYPLSKVQRTDQATIVEE